MMGPVTFIERQVAHVWGASMIAIAMLFPLEWWLDLNVLSLAPMLAVITAMVFIVKAGMLSGEFYRQTIALLLTAVAMAVVPRQILMTIDRGFFPRDSTGTGDRLGVFENEVVSVVAGD